jgi:DNA polymerase delta subunit 2
MSTEQQRSTTTSSNPDNSSKSTLTRAYASYQPRWQRFMVKQPTLVATDPPYSRQYSHLYTSRLMELRSRCLLAAAACGTTNDAVVVSRIIELHENVPCTAVGTLVKDCSASRSNDTLSYSSYFADSNGAVNSTIEPPLRTYCSDKDLLILEDESGRVELLLTDQTRDNRGDPLSIHDVATGVVVAVTGVILPDSNGVMTVSTVSFPEFLESRQEEQPLPPPLQQQLQEPCVLLVSGLRCNSTTALEPKDDYSSHSLRTDLLLDYIAGNLPTLEAYGACIAHVILAGGNCGIPEPLPTTSSTAASEKALKKRGTESAALPVQEFDIFLSKLVSRAYVPVDILPGKQDPTNANWPQQPMHPCLFSVLSSCSSSSDSSSTRRIHRTTNPYEARIGGKLFLGTDGSNVRDLRHYLLVLSTTATEEDPSTASITDATSTGRIPPSELETLGYTLKFGHMAPTAPDSLHSSPLVGQDPYILRDVPDVYFAGNCSEFASSEVFISDQRCRLVCIPDFSLTHEVVLVNLNTLETECIKIIDYDVSSDMDCTPVVTTNINGAPNY